MLEEDILSEYDVIKSRYKKPISKELKMNKNHVYSIYPISWFGNHSKRTHTQKHKKTVRSRERRERKDITPEYFQKKYIKYGYSPSKPSYEKLMIRRNHISRDFYEIIESYNRNPELFTEKEIIKVDFFDFFVFEDLSDTDNYHLGNIKAKKEFENKIIINENLTCNCDRSANTYLSHNLHHGNNAKSFIIQFILNDETTDVIYETLFYRNYMKSNMSKINYIELVGKGYQRVDNYYRNEIKRKISWRSEKFLSTSKKEDSHNYDHCYGYMCNNLLMNFYKMNYTKDVLFYIFDSNDMLAKSQEFDKKNSHRN